MKKTVTKTIPASTVEIDLSKSVIAGYIADDATPPSSGGPGSLHLQISAPGLAVQHLVLMKDGAFWLDTAASPPALGAELADGKKVFDFLTAAVQAAAER